MAVFDVAPSQGSTSKSKNWKKIARKDEHCLLNNDEKEEMELYDEDEGDGYGGDDFEEDGEDDETKSN